MQQPIYENIKLNSCTCTVSDRIRLENKTEIVTDRIERVLDVTAFTSLEEKTVSDGKIRYGGKIIYQIFYQDKDGAFKKYECGSEYAGVLADANIKENCVVPLTVTVEKTETDISGIRLTVAVYLNVKAEVLTSSEVSAFCGLDGVIVNKTEIPVVKSFGTVKTVFPLEEEFELPFTVAEVLSHSVKAVITSVQCGVGCIIVDGEAVFNALILKTPENGDIIKEIRTLPFRVEIECQDAMPVMKAVARVFEKSFKANISVDGETGKSVVALSVALAFESEAFSDESVTIACDAFSVSEKLEVFGDCFTARKPCELRSFNERVNGRAVISEISAESRLVAVGGERVEVATVSVKDGGITVDGVLSMNCYLKDGSGKAFTVNCQTPVVIDLNQNLDCACVPEVLVTVKSAGARLVSLGEVELDAELYITVYPMEKQQVKYLKEIKTCGEKERETCAISVYIPMAGEELWSISKRLNVCPEELVATNKDLQFPLSGKERIVIYRQM